MIFVTVGSMLPFDRLVRMMDAWSLAHPKYDVFAQVGGGLYEPRNCRWERMLTPSAFTSAVEDAEMIVAHAGTGSVFTAARFGKPIVIIPRRAAQREMTTDHQIDTAKWLESSRGIYVVWKEHELDRQIEAALGGGDHVGNVVPKSAPVEFIQRIRASILADELSV